MLGDYYLDILINGNIIKEKLPAQLHLGGNTLLVLAIALFVLLLLPMVNLSRLRLKFKKLSKDLDGLQKLVLNKKRELGRLEDKIRKQRHGLTPKEKNRLEKELREMDSTQSRRELSQLKQWEMAEGQFGVAGMSPDEKEIIELKKRKTEIGGLIDLSRKKYHKRDLDQETFREISKEYKRDLIEVENKIKTLEKKNAK